MAGEPKLARENLHRSMFSHTSEQTQFKAHVATFIEWLKGYLDTIALIAGLGSSITFSIIVSEIVDPSLLDSSTPTPRTGVLFDLEQVRLIVSLSWAFFTIAVGIAIFAKILFIDPISQRHLEVNLRTNFFKYQLGSVLFLLNMLPTLAFLLASLAVTAYVPVVGWLAFSCSGIAACLALVMSTGLLGLGPSIPRLLREI